MCFNSDACFSTLLKRFLQPPHLGDLSYMDAGSPAWSFWWDSVGEIFCFSFLFFIQQCCEQSIAAICEWWRLREFSCSASSVGTGAALGVLSSFFSQTEQPWNGPRKSLSWSWKSKAACCHLQPERQVLQWMLWGFFNSSPRSPVLNSLLIYLLFS